MGIIVATLSSGANKNGAFITIIKAPFKQITAYYRTRIPFAFNIISFLGSVIFAISSLVLPASSA